MSGGSPPCRPASILVELKLGQDRAQANHGDPGVPVRVIPRIHVCSSLSNVTSYLFVSYSVNFVATIKTFWEIFPSPGPPQKPLLLRYFPMNQESEQQYVLHEGKHVYNWIVQTPSFDLVF